MWRRLETCFRKVSCCYLQGSGIIIGIMTSAPILSMLHVLSHMSPLGLTSSVIVEVVDSPCLVVGTDVTLRCQPDGVPRSQVTWLQNVMELSSNSKYRISDYPDFTLTITDVVSSDAGSYTCRAVNTLTNGTASGIVTETFNDFSMACGEFAVNVHIFIHVCQYMLLCMYSCTNHAYSFTCTYHTLTCTHTGTHTCTHTHTHTHTHARARTLKHTHREKE